MNLLKSRIPSERDLKTMLRNYSSMKFVGLRPSLLLRRQFSSSRSLYIIENTHQLTQLAQKLKQDGKPITLYKATKPYRYIIPSLLFGLIASYNLFDIITWVAPMSTELFQEDLNPANISSVTDATASPGTNAGTSVATSSSDTATGAPGSEIKPLTLENKALSALTRFGPLVVFSLAYFATSVVSFTVPTRLVKSIKYEPLTQICEIQTFWSKKTTRLPFTDYRMGRYTKAYTGQGKYDASGKGLFFLLWYKQNKVPYIIDRSGEFYQSAVTFDYFLNVDSINKKLNVKSTGIDEHALETVATEKFHNSSREAVLKSLKIHSKQEEKQ